MVKMTVYITIPKNAYYHFCKSFYVMNILAVYITIPQKRFINSGKVCIVKSGIVKDRYISSFLYSFLYYNKIIINIITEHEYTLIP